MMRHTKCMGWIAVRPEYNGERAAIKLRVDRKNSFSCHQCGSPLQHQRN